MNIHIHSDERQRIKYSPSSSPRPKLKNIQSTYIFCKGE